MASDEIRAKPREAPRSLNVPQYRAAIQRAIREYGAAVEAASEELVFAVEQASDGLTSEGVINE